MLGCYQKLSMLTVQRLLGNMMRPELNLSYKLFSA